MDLSIIVAMSENRVIGRENRLPWRLPADMKRFKALTMGHHLILGRRTFESLPGPLPGRRILVVTRNPAYAAGYASVAGSFEEALSLAEAAGESEAFVGGGAQIYRVALELAGRMYLTLVRAQVTGDTYFPPYEQDAWRLVWSEDHQADENNPYPYSFQDWVKRSEFPLK